MNETLSSEDYDLIPELDLRIPTLVIHGEDDNLIPQECATHIADTIPGARLSILERCGHFSYFECSDGVYNVIREFVLANSMERPDK